MSADPVYYAGNFEFGFWLLTMKHVSRRWGRGREVGSKERKKIQKVLPILGRRHTPVG